MADLATMFVEKGPDLGKTVTVPLEGLRIGRSSRNDLVLNDPAMSRFHCRVYSTPDGGLFVTDLGSSNDTCVNDKAIQETRLAPGDRLAVGGTVLRVLDATADATVAVAADNAFPGSAADPVIDLGLNRNAPPAGAPVARRQLKTGIVMAVLVIAGLATIIALAGLIWRDLPRQETPPPPPPPAPPLTAEIYYEKIKADTNNIFRYLMRLKENRLSVEIDDIANERQARETTVLDEALATELAATLKDSGFFDLEPEYTGVAPDVHDRREIRLTIAKRTHGCVVLNRVAPDTFNDVSERLEILVQNELGTMAWALSPEELREKARDAYLLGRSLSDERSLRHENLYRAIRSFREVEWYLEAIEPKPDFYADAIARRRQTERDLEERLKNLEFLAERAIRGREWSDAAVHLRTILDTIPDRSDDRHKRTVTQLLDVERRLERGL